MNIRRNPNLAPKEEDALLEWAENKKPPKKFKQPTRKGRQQVSELEDEEAEIEMNDDLSIDYGGYGDNAI